MVGDDEAAMQRRRRRRRQRDLRRELGTVPRLALVPALPLRGDAELRDRLLESKERRRNALLEQERALKRERQHAGRVEHAVKVHAAVRIQSVYRMREERMHVAGLVEEMKRRIREEEELAKRMEEERRRALEARRWLARVSSLPASALKDVLLQLRSFDDRFELRLEGWGGHKADILGALAVFTGARDLRFSRCMLAGRAGAKADAGLMAEALRHQEKLQRLDIVDCAMDALALEPILHAVAQSCSGALRVLRLPGNWLGRGRWDCMDDSSRPVYEEHKAAAQQVSACLRGTPGLRELDLSRNYMGGAAFNALVAGQAFAQPRRALVSVDLSHNKIGIKGAYSLSHVIAACVAMRSLRVAGNDLHSNGLIAIESPLALHRALRDLDLSDNGLGDKSAVTASQILRTNARLRGVQLANNGFTEKGLHEIIAAVTTFHRPAYALEALDLSGNRFGAHLETKTACLDALARMIAKNTSLARLGLRGMRLVEPRRSQPRNPHRERREVLHPLALLLSRVAENSTLREIDLRGNALTDRVNAPLLAFRIVRGAQSLRAGMYIPRDRQDAVAGLFARFLAPSDSYERLSRAVMLVLAFDADSRNILV